MQAYRYEKMLGEAVKHFKDQVGYPTTGDVSDWQIAYCRLRGLRMSQTEKVRFAYDVSDGIERERNREAVRAMARG